jgi:hypothetical protein
LELDIKYALFTISLKETEVLKELLEEITGQVVFILNLSSDWLRELFKK